MSSLVSAIKDTVPISNFNRGLAGKIFADVRTSGAKLVMKNNMAECVLLSPEEYVRIMDQLDEARLLAMSLSRTENYDPCSNVPISEVMEKYNITQEELNGMDEVELE